MVNVVMLEYRRTRPIIFPVPIAEDVMWINYGAKISQSPTALLVLEKRRRGRPLADRVKLLRLLKTQAIRSLRAAAPVLGYSARQLQRWWATSTTRGLEALVRWQPRPGRQEQVSPEAWTALATEMRAGRVARLKEAQRYLRTPWGIDYRSLNGLSQLFKRHKTKLKPGRRRYRQANLAAQAAFKK
jgi:transposase